MEELRYLGDQMMYQEQLKQVKVEQEASWAELNRLKEQLSKLEAKIDSAKRCLYFPTVHGYRYNLYDKNI